MRKIIYLFFSFFCLTLSAQQVIDNKGNRNQSYPIITTTKPEIVNLINQVSQDSIESRIRYMQKFIRDAISPAALTIQNWLVDHFESYGYNDVSVHYFIHDSLLLDAGNVVVVKKGSEFPDEYIIVSSHYDHPDGPGANDNASGTAGVMECARLLKNFPTKRSIIFVPFNAEELWMVGSLPFAKKCAAENKNVIAHFNMDMIGWFPPHIPNTIMASGYSYISQSLFDYYCQTANTYIPSIPTKRLSKGDSYGGDHMPFNMYEYPSLYVGDIEYQSLNTCYHKPCDTIGPNDPSVDCGVNRLDLAKAFVRAVLAATAELANAWLPPQNLSACSGIDKITISWDSNNVSTSYKIFKNDVFLDETTQNFYVDKNVVVGNKYEYYVIAVDNQAGKETAPSNKDKITFVEPLQLPYYSDFSTNKYGFEQSDWKVVHIGGNRVLCNSGYGYIPDNYLSIAELDWFPIPSDIENLSIRFKWAGDLTGIWHNTGLYFEVTNDRKTWHKLAYISGDVDWKYCEFSLNPYINSDFFQGRFRLESSGAGNRYYTKIGIIMDIEINFDPVGIREKENIPYISSFNFFPNPASTHINIVTKQQYPYHIAIYDMTGKIVFAQDNFKDGKLDVSRLNKGNYLIVASIKQHRFARKLVIQ